MPENDSKTQMDALISRMWSQQQPAMPSVDVISVELSRVDMSAERRQHLQDEAAAMRQRLFPEDAG